MPIEESDNWHSRIQPVLGDSWFEARKQILLASRLNSDSDHYFFSDPSHMGDPAQIVDQHMHQHTADRLRQEVPGVQVFGEEAPIRQLLLSKSFKYIAYLDPIDGSAQAWSLPGGWGQAIIIQQFVGRHENRPKTELRYAGVLDAEGGIVSYDITEPYVPIDLITQGFDGGEAYDADPLIYDCDTRYEITAKPVALIGGYKPRWWSKFSAVRERILIEWPEAQVFNVAGAPVTRKVIQNADNVVMQLNRSSLWDGVGALFIAQAGGTVVPLVEGTPAEVKATDVVQWWSTLGYEHRESDDTMQVALPIPPFVAGMNRERVMKAHSIWASINHDEGGTAH